MNGGIVGPLFLAWLVGFARPDGQVGDYVTDGMRRSIGILIVGMILGGFSGRFPKITTGIAWLIAVTVIFGQSQAIGDTIGRLTGKETA